MFLESYYTEKNDGIHFSRQQGSDFAKQVADDFNPLHDHDSKRFCVPGDLLFSLVLKQCGLSQRMHFTFSGMVTGDAAIIVHEEDDAITLKDSNDKDYLNITRAGDINKDAATIQGLTRSYVEFSGQTFPHILVPLMRDNGVMINTARPMVIYESMVIDMLRLDIGVPSLKMSRASLDVQGKRGKVRLEFNLIADGEIVGKGEKNMVLSGLKEYDQAKLDALVEFYAERKKSYAAA
jgi:hypothetical protein